MFEESPRQSLSPRPETSCQRLRGNLGETPRRDPIEEELRVLLDHLIPLRMGNDGDDPGREQLKKYLPHTRRNELGVEFDQQVVLVIDGKRGVVSQGFLDVFIREVKIAPERILGVSPTAAWSSAIVASFSSGRKMYRAFE